MTRVCNNFWSSNKSTNVIQFYSVHFKIGAKDPEREKILINGPGTYHITENFQNRNSVRSWA
jgi:hypothetical protein